MKYRLVANCVQCSAEFKPHPQSIAKFCSGVCQQIHSYNINVEKWLSGNLPGWTGKSKRLRNFVRKYVLSNNGTACSICEWDMRHPCDNAILTEIDHIDGDASNCDYSNLRVLCPNCHAMTSTYRNRNVKSARIR